MKSRSHSVWLSLRLMTLAWVCLGSAAVAFQETRLSEKASDLTDLNFDAWRDCIKATESELDWQELPWTTSYHEGLLQAATENKPLVLWAMNGHPMGCT